MIRADPDRPGVFIVDMSAELVDVLSDEWSEPVQVKIDGGELTIRKPL